MAISSYVRYVLPRQPFHLGRQNWKAEPDDTSVAHPSYSLCALALIPEGRPAGSP